VLTRLSALGSTSIRGNLFARSPSPITLISFGDEITIAGCVDSEGTCGLANDYRPREGMAVMKLMATACAVGLVVAVGAANAQSDASGRGSTTGDPAASSATPGTAPTTGNSMKPSRSGSGTSTSGGSDANNDQGRDKMPESNKNIRPLDPQHKPDSRI
jgi:hypothetical protein